MGHETPNYDTVLLRIHDRLKINNSKQTSSSIPEGEAQFGISYTHAI